MNDSNKYVFYQNIIVDIAIKYSKLHREMIKATIML